MNGGFNPSIISHTQKPQTASQQKPFYFGGSWVPSLLGNKSQMIGGGLTQEIKKKLNIKEINKLY